jgi:hypothetical protein
VFYGLFRNVLGDSAFPLTDDEYFNTYLLLFFGGVPVLLEGSLYWLLLKLSRVTSGVQED